MLERKATEESHKQEANAMNRVGLVTSELWGLSQFWYDDDTCSLLAHEVLALAGEVASARAGEGSSDPSGPVRVACVSCPSTYKALLSTGIPAHVEAHILEYDRRFGEAFGDAFSFYDFNASDSFRESLRGSCDIICLDPPFLQEDTLAAFARTVAAMARVGAAPRLMLCTGAIMTCHARRLLNVRPVRARVQHVGGRLSNPFALFVSADYNEAAAARLGGWDVEAEAAEAP